MHIASITLTVSEVANLGDYSSTRPSLTITANLDSDDHVGGVADLLFQQAKQTIHDQIDKEFLARGRSPLYYAGPRYDVRYIYDPAIMVVVPTGYPIDPDSRNVYFHSETSSMPFDHALMIADEKARQRDDGNAWEILIAQDVAELEYVRALVTERRQQYEAAQQRKREEEVQRRNAALAKQLAEEEARKAAALGNLPPSNEDDDEE